MGCTSSLLQRVSPAKRQAQLRRARSLDRDDTSVVTQPSQEGGVSAPKRKDNGELIYRCPNSHAKGLIAMAKAGDLVKGRQLLMLGADPSAPGMWGSTPLLVACEYGRQEFAELLLSHRCEVDTPNHKRATPLLYACIEGFHTIVDKLIAQGAAVDPDVAIVYNSKRDIVGPLTPLAAAAANGHLLIVNKLIDSGAQVNRRIVPVEGADNKDLFCIGGTALSVACAMGETRVAQALLSAGADVSIADFKSKTALHYACMQAESAALVDVLINHINADRKLDKVTIVNATSQRNETALHIACAKGGLHTLEALLVAGADPNTLSTKHLTPLHVAVQKGCKAGVDLLISHGADPSIPDLNKQTPHDFAIKLNRPKIAELLEQFMRDPSQEQPQPHVTDSTSSDTTTKSVLHAPETAFTEKEDKNITQTTSTLQPVSPSAKKSTAQSPRAAKMINTRNNSRKQTKTNASTSKPDRGKPTTKQSKVSQQEKLRTQQTTSTASSTSTGGSTTSSNDGKSPSPKNGTPTKPPTPRGKTSTLTRIRHRPEPVDTAIAEGEAREEIEVTVETPKAHMTQEAVSTTTKAEAVSVGR